MPDSAAVRIAEQVERLRVAITVSQNHISRRHQWRADPARVFDRLGGGLDLSDGELTDDQLLRGLEEAEADAEQREIVREMRDTMRLAG